MASVIPPEIIEEIKTRNDIVEVIGSFVQLKRAGSTNFKGLCPFHQEKTPSFHVDSARQMFHCFGCGKGGDVVRFLMDKENLTFVDALHMLATRAGIIIPEYNNTVRISGAVMYPNTVSYQDNKTLAHYIEQAGGYGTSAKKSKAYIIYMNGQVKKAKKFSSSIIQPGCEIIVPTKERNQFRLQNILSIATTSASLATMVASIANIIK